MFNDKFGFKNKNSVYQDKVDLMIIGDSFTEGVPFGNDIHVANLINNKSNYNALNYGVSGTGPLMSLAIVKEYGKHFYPKDIFYLFVAFAVVTSLCVSVVFLIISSVIMSVILI